jgi:hypothetical protein
MCFFLCLALPKKDSRVRDVISRAFEVKEVTDWPIGKVTRGNRDNGSSYLVTDGGCSCFILGLHHARGEPKVTNVVEVVKELLKRAPCVSILIHYSSSELAREAVTARAKRVLIVDEFVREFPTIQEDVRYVVTKGQDG